MLMGCCLRAWWPQMICIDEAHFLPDLVEFCTEAAKTKRVLVAGLDLDFRRQHFLSMVLSS